MSEDMAQRLTHYAAALKSFTSSSKLFQILHSTPAPPSTASPLRTLHILDSSFNPPTIAHLRICLSALHSTGNEFPKRVLLLLATQNADKEIKPAVLEHRLVMMQVFAEDLLSQFHSANTSEKKDDGEVGVDLGLITAPYFHDKAKIIEESGVYATTVEQIHCTGYDTLTRFLDPKYYPPKHDLSPLEPFLEKHRLRISYRAGDTWGGRKEQDEWLSKMGEERLDGMGGKKSWVKDKRLELVETRQSGDVIVSSTKVREAVKSGDLARLEELVTKDVGQWILRAGLYAENQ